MFSLRTTAIMCVLFLACGGLSSEQRIAYSAEVARCIQNERAIIDRQGTTLEEDERDLAVERARCDDALASIEHGGQ